MAEQISLDQFGYLNANEAAAIIDPTEAQDLLNVDVTPGGKSIKKRDGYGLYKTLGSNSAAIHGAHHFYDSSGNDVQVWGSSRTLFGIVGDATATTIISSATLGTTWDCADTQGFAYCVTSSRDALIQTNGVTQSWHTSPLGTMVAVTPERLIVAGVAATPNTLHFSKASDFKNFTTGVTVPDGFAEVIAAPGSRITHVEYACGKVLWWKDESFGYLLGTDQTNISIGTISNRIGTQDNSSAIDDGGNVYFRGQDGHIYRYDCASLQKLSTEISPYVQTSGRRTSNSYFETIQSEFQAGTILPTASLSTTISAGSIVPSSWSATETSQSDFTGGARSNLSVSNNGLIISTSNTNCNNAVCTMNVSNDTGSCFVSALQSCDTSDKGGDGTSRAVCGTVGAGMTVTVAVVQIGGSTLQSTAIPWAAGACSWTQISYTMTSHTRKRAKLTITHNDGSMKSESSEFIISGQPISIWYKMDRRGVGTNKIFIWDSNVNDSSTYWEGGISTITTGNYTSAAFDTGNTLSKYVGISYTASLDDEAPAFALQSGDSDSGPWTNLVYAANSSTDTAQRYVRYVSTVTSSTGDAGTILEDVTITARSSGTYYSSVANKPNLTTWDTFNATVVDNGGSHSFYMRSSTNSFTALSSTPAWTAQANGAVVSVATGTYFQVKDDFVLDASTDVPTLSDLTINWFEGSASDKAYATWFGDAIWWSMAYGSGITTNNYIFKYDLIRQGWTLYDFGTGGFLTQNNRLYFGSTSVNKVYRYGNSTSDDGNAISAYWKSKDFPGPDPWLENEYTQLDVIARRNSGNTLTLAYGLNSSTTTTSVSMPLTSTTDSIIRYKKLLPLGKIGGLFNLKFSDSSSTSAWEVLGFRINYRPLTYRPSQ